MKIIYSSKAPEPIGPYVQGLEKNRLFFFSGQIALNEKGELKNKNLEEEITQVLKNINNVLKSTQLEKDNVIKTTIFLKSMDDFEIINKFYGDFFENHKPARSTIEVSRLPKDARVEIEVIAVR